MQSAPNWLTSPLTSASVSGRNMYRNARLRLKTWTKRNMNVSNIPVTRTAPINGSPHTHPSATSTHAVSVRSQSADVSTVSATGEPGWTISVATSARAVCAISATFVICI